MNAATKTSKYFAWLTGVICLLWAAASFAQDSRQIQKCRDEDGQWHYGNRVNAGCQSLISDLNTNGIIINQSEPFKPTSSLQALAIKQQQLFDQNLLRRHSSVKSIEQEKERKISELRKEQNINLELIEKMGAEIQVLRARNSLTAQSAFQERLVAIDQYLNRHESLSSKIEKTTAEYNLLISDYLQALSRSDKNQSAALDAS